jgi:hypothetical protein
MAITKTLVPAKSKTTKTHTPSLTTPVKSEITLKAEEFVLLHATLEKLNAFQLIKEYEKIKKGLQEYAIANAPDDAEPYTFETEKGDVTFKPCAETTVITDPELMRKALGQKLFNEIAKVSITDLRTYLSQVEVEKFSKKAAGSRALASVVVKPEAK